MNADVVGHAYAYLHMCNVLNLIVSEEPDICKTHIGCYHVHFIHLGLFHLGPVHVG